MGDLVDLGHRLRAAAVLTSGALLAVAASTTPAAGVGDAGSDVAPQGAFGDLRTSLTRMADAAPSATPNPFPVDRATTPQAASAAVPEPRKHKRVKPLSRVDTETPKLPLGGVERRQATAPVDASAAFDRPSGPQVMPCPETAAADPRYDAMYLDTVAHGLRCDDDHVVIGALTDDYWHSRDLYQYLIRLDTDGDPATGCEGAERAVVMDEHSLRAGVGRMWSLTGSCTRGEWLGDVAAFGPEADRPGRFVAVAVPRDLLGPASNPHVDQSLESWYDIADWAPDSGPSPPISPAEPPPAPGDWDVTGGQAVGPVAAALELSRATFGHEVARAYVVAADAFPDGLIAGPAAAISGGPVLPVRRQSVPSGVLAELRRLSPGEIVQVGGLVDPAVREELAQIAPVRVVAGPNRYATAATVATDTFPRGVYTAYLAGGHSVPDALAAGAVTGSAGAPLLLTATAALSSEAAEALAVLGTERVVIAGGPGAVSTVVEDALRDRGLLVERVAGDTRFETAVALSGHRFGNKSARSVFLAPGNLADSVAVVAAAGFRTIPVLLTEGHCLRADTAAEAARLGAHVLEITGTRAGEADAPAPAC